MAPNATMGEDHRRSSCSIAASLDGNGPAKSELAEMVLKAAEDGRRRNNVSSRLAQPRLANLKLHGRQDDLKFLRGRLRSALGGGGKTEKGAKGDRERGPGMLLVSGPSGTGKSALVTGGLREPARRIGAAFAGGKFDVMGTAGAPPLSAFVQAMESLTEFVLEGRNAQRIKEEIENEFGEEDATLLVRAFPGCEDLFSSVGEDGFGGGETTDGRETVMRLQYVIRRLLKIVCTRLKGVVLFIDDLQWSDAATLDLLKSISLDGDIPSLLLVGSYRDDEVTDSDPLALQIQELKQMGVEINEVKIGNLGAGDVRSLVAEALGMEDNEDAVGTLAATVHKKTDGNAFFVLMFLRSLSDEGLLKYNFGVMAWIWDDDAVNAKLATENVATVLVNKLGRLREGSQNILKVASCLGGRFNASVVAVVTDNLSPPQLRRLSSSVAMKAETECDDVTVSDLDSFVHEFEQEGLCEKEAEDIWNFSHDKIQSAAFELISPEKRDSFRGEIGKLLMRRLDPETLEASLFEVVSLSNCEMDSIWGDERRELAEMNLRAGMKASANAAFDSAAVYFKAGRKLMGPTGWEVDRDAMLKLCSEGANACFISGDLESMNDLIDEVLGKDITVGDKFRVFEVKIMAAQAAGDYGESLSLGLEVRRQLGLPVPQNKPALVLTIVKEYLKTKRALKNRTAEELANLPILMDERIIMGQRMLELLGMSTYQAAPTMFPLMSFLSVRASLKHGLNASSCDAFGSFGVLLCAAFGDPQRGREMADTVNLIMEKPGMARMKSRSILLCETFILHWTAPLQGTLAPLLEGYKIGLETGDIESAAWSITIRSTHLFFSGRPLDGLQHELETYIFAATQLNQTSAKYNMLPYMLTVKKLRGMEMDEGELDFDDIVAHAVKSSNETLSADTIVVQLQLHVILSNWKAAKSLLVEAGDLRSILPGSFSGVSFTFLESLICLKAAQVEKAWLKRKSWKKRARKSMKLLRSWAKKGNVNVVHYLHLLAAELAVLKGNGKKAVENFKSAITVATRNGFMQDRALSHELASAYFAGQGDDFWKEYHIVNAKECYLEWGAKAKATQIRGTQRRFSNRRNFEFNLTRSH